MATRGGGAKTGQRTAARRRQGAGAPAISIIMPVRNGAQYIRRAIEGLRRSEFQDFELIVIDDASRDGSADIAAELGAKVIRCDRWVGGVLARAKGLEMAKA